MIKIFNPQAMVLVLIQLLRLDLPRFNSNLKKTKSLMNNRHLNLPDMCQKKSFFANPAFGSGTRSYLIWKNLLCLPKAYLNILLSWSELFKVQNVFFTRMPGLCLLKRDLISFLNGLQWSAQSTYLYLRFHILSKKLIWFLVPFAIWESH